jgi:hypothetical protein
MPQRPFILLVLAASLASSAVSARAQDQPATPAANPDKPPQPAATSDPQNPPPPDSAPDASPQQSPVKDAVKNHHVITNDDLDKGDTFGSPGSEIDISGINDCDRNCFENVRRAAPSLADPGGQWKRELLHAIDKVTADAKWQGALAGLARAKGRFCQLSREKNEALANDADPKNVTERELSIDDEYDRKFKAAQAELNAAFADADAVMRGYSGIAVPFMNLQKGRVSSAPCIQPQPPQYRPYQPPYDPPDDPDDP